MADDFDRALAVTLSFEGGFVDDPADPGGATNMGITQAEYNIWQDSQELPHHPVKEITPGEVEAIYRRNYWDLLSCTFMDWPLSLFVFDAGVHHGIGKARTMLAAVQLADEAPERELFAILAIRRYLFRRDAATNPALSKFLGGWDNRIEKLRVIAGL